jgi:hypothetical protein
LVNGYIILSRLLQYIYGFATAIYNGVDNKCLIFDETHYVAFSEKQVIDLRFLR